MDVVIPRLGVAMTEGIVVEWLVSDGDFVAEGQPLYVVGTDKVDSEVECPGNGTITILVHAGETRGVGDVVARIG